MDAGDVVGECASTGCVGADPAEVQGLVEQHEPPFEVGGREGSLFVDAGVGAERVSCVALNAEQGAAPEGGELGEVF